MKFGDMVDYLFNYGGASEYVIYYWDDLEAIYNSDTPPNGTKGYVWRQFHGKPNSISALTVYLSQKVFDLESSLSTSEKEIRKSSKETKSLKARVSNNESELKTVKRTNSKLEKENMNLKARLDDDTAKALMESITLLSDRCKNSGINVQDLPHHKNISPQQIQYLKSLIAT